MGLQKLIFICFVSTIFSLNLLASSNEVQTYETENVFSCSMLNGNLTHKVGKRGNGNYFAHLAFPLYYKEPSKEIIEQKKEEWKNWDGQSPQPSDPRKIAIGVPLTSSNIMSFDIDQLEKKNSFFEKIFPGTDPSSLIPAEIGNLLVDFNSQQCKVLQKEGFISVYCENDNAIEVNGVKIDRVSIRMVNQRLTALTSTEDGNESTLEVQNLVTTDVVFLSKNTYYRSKFTYTPNGDDEQCRFGNKKLTDFVF